MARASLKTVEILMNAGDWVGAAYMMGHVLEYGLKGAICRRLNLLKYPDDRKEKAYAFFRTHEFIPLLLLSGLSTLFSTQDDKAAFQNWSDFTNEYLGNWTIMRYDPDTIWDEFKIKKLYLNLTEKSKGILTIIKKRW